MSEQNSVQESAHAIRKLWEKHGIKSPFRLLGFCLSLLPIPVISQAGAALDRHLSDKAFEAELASVWSKLESANAAVNKVETLEEAIAQIAQTVQNNQNLLSMCEHLSSKLSSSGSEFVVDTSTQSYQQIVNSVVQAGRVFISATGASTNSIGNTRFISPSTHLHASEGSRNLLDGTSFSDNDGYVRMQGIAALGNINVTGDSIGFGPNGGLEFLSATNDVSGPCPECGGRVTVDRRKLLGSTSIQCPHCLVVSPFTVR